MLHAAAETREVCVTSKRIQVENAAPVQVNDQAWQRRVEYSSEIVGARKAHETVARISRAIAEKKRWS